MHFIKMTGKILIGLMFIFLCAYVVTYSLIDSKSMATSYIQTMNEIISNPFVHFLVWFSILYSIFIALFFYYKDSEVYDIGSLACFILFVTSSMCLNNFVFEVVGNADLFTGYVEKSVLFNTGMIYMLFLAASMLLIQLRTILTVILTRYSWTSIYRYLTYIWSNSLNIDLLNGLLMIIPIIAN